MQMSLFNLREILKTTWINMCLKQKPSFSVMSQLSVWFRTVSDYASQHLKVCTVVRVGVGLTLRQWTDECCWWRCRWWHSHVLSVPPGVWVCLSATASGDLLCTRSVKSWNPVPPPERLPNQSVPGQPAAQGNTHTHTQRAFVHRVQNDLLKSLPTSHYKLIGNEFI